jgi:hypothetical protein
MGAALASMFSLIVVAFVCVSCGIALGAWWAGGRRVAVDHERLADIEAAITEAVADLENANRVLRLSNPTDALLDPMQKAEKHLIGLLNRVMLWSSKA